ncbi:MAG: acyl-CoA dehydratase activase-related protein, partial [Candidatus Muiribacteriaceae bacterium]
KDKCDKIFFPKVVFEKQTTPGRNYNCPVVTGMPDVIKSLSDTELLSPDISFADSTIAKKTVWNFVREFGVTKNEYRKAYSEAEHFSGQIYEHISKMNLKLLKRAPERCVVFLARPYHGDDFLNGRLPKVVSDMGYDVITSDIIPEFENNPVCFYTQWENSNRIVSTLHHGLKYSPYFVYLNSFNCGPDVFTLQKVSEDLNKRNANFTILKIDEFNDNSSNILRIRTMFSFPRRIKKKNETVQISRAKKDIRKIVFPYFSDFHSPFIPYLFRKMGYEAEVLPPSDIISEREGLKYINNEVCYPAILVAGDIIRYLKSCENPSEITVGLTQTSGQCRASSYISIIGSALQKAGFDNRILAFGKTYDENGVKALGLPKRVFSFYLLKVVLYGDALARLYYSKVHSEKREGDCQKLLNKYIRRGKVIIGAGTRVQLFDLIKDAVHDFERIPSRHMPEKTVGIVGEIYVRYNRYANNDIARFFNRKGIRTVIPGFADFFRREIVNVRYNKEKNLRNTGLFYYLTWPLEHIFKKYIEPIENILKTSSDYIKNEDIFRLAEYADKHIGINAQFGEGWLLAGEISALAENGINDIVCIQPFGCISNHITGKGIEKSLKAQYPELNLFFIDVDQDTSEANIENRLRFITHH